ncbi:MAG: hypothetical protein Q4G26_13270, partial [Paracoccus sp. (in: a-proteobacteria)]|nr:hypothetical protein [Paracoccus sp. (in: a-proteobacteria)]
LQPRALSVIAGTAIGGRSGARKFKDRKRGSKTAAWLKPCAYEGLRRFSGEAGGNAEKYRRCVMYILLLFPILFFLVTKTFLSELLC